jgi:hypothetical protein
MVRVPVEFAVINASLRFSNFDPVAEIAERVTPVCAEYLPSGSTLWSILF